MLREVSGKFAKKCGKIWPKSSEILIILAKFGKKCTCVLAIFKQNIELRERCKGLQRSALCRSRRELSNEYLDAKFGFDTAENEPCKNSNFLTFLTPEV